MLFFSARVDWEGRNARPSEDVLSRPTGSVWPAADTRPRGAATDPFHTTVAYDSRALTSGNILLLGKVH